VRRTDTLIIGGGQAGLAMSRCLAARSLDHVVLERGRVGERWRSERWESLRLLTPNWQSRLPGFRYEGPDPEGFMTMPEVTAYLERYARSFNAPVETGTTVTSVEEEAGGYRVTTDRAAWRARNVVIATGYSDVPAVPGLAARVPAGMLQVVPTRYRRPADLPPGGVLVVGASATGTQLAEEIHLSGRPVTLAVGRHTRLPRRYRGRDILWWMEAMGILDEPACTVYDVEVSRDQPSLQLAGRPDLPALDLPRLRELGVRLAGRALDADGHVMSFEDNLVATVAAADAKLAVLLDRIERFIAGRALPGQRQPPEPFVPFWPEVTTLAPPTRLDLRAEGIETVIWATGFRRSYPWLRVPVLDARGELVHDGGVTPSPGLYALGLHFQRQRNSAFLDGVGADAEVLAAQIAERGRAQRGAPRAQRGRGEFHDVHQVKFTPPPLQTPPSLQPPTPLRTPVPSYDAVIIGARCAGAATALLLARQGLSVLVVDRGQYGTDTLSTLAIMRGGVLQLQRWGVLERLHAAGTPIIRSTSFQYGDEVIDIQIKPRGGVEGLLAPRRTLLDAALVDEARASGAEVAYGVRLLEILRGSGGRVQGVVVEDRLHGARPVSASIVIGADGMKSTLARLVGSEPYHLGRHAGAVIYGFWSGLDANGVQWLYRPGVSAGVIPTNDGQTLVFAAMPVPRFLREAQGDLAGSHAHVVEEASPRLADALRRGRRVGRLHGFAGHPGFIKRSWGPGWALVGDAAYFKDPITAHGITDALRDADLIARAVGAGSDAALADYQAERDELSMGLFAITDDIASFDWDLQTLQERHLALSDEMNREVLRLSALDQVGCA
jgi:putative flavoprotein involved in K+ transport